MKKKKVTKKLTLAKETVRNLEADKLQEFHGGLCLSGPGSCVSVELCAEPTLKC
jgi:hypothetical protein